MDEATLRIGEGRGGQHMSPEILNKAEPKSLLIT